MLALAVLATVLIEAWSGQAHRQAAARDEGQDDLLVLRFGDAAGLPLDGLIKDLDYHVVSAGETLTSIARGVLGDPSLARFLVELNGLDSPDQLAEGQVLRLR